MVRGLGSRDTVWVEPWAKLLTSHVTLGKLLDQDELPFPYVRNEQKGSSYLTSVRIK